MITQETIDSSRGPRVDFALLRSSVQNQTAMGHENSNTLDLRNPFLPQLGVTKYIT